MTAINRLVDAAGSPCCGLPGSMSVLEGAMLSVQALCESLLAALENVPSQDYFKAEFRLPAEPHDLKDELQAETNVNIDVYAIARQLQDAIGLMQKESINVPELCSSLFGGLPEPDTSVSREISRELTREYTSEISKKIIHESTVDVGEHHVTNPPQHMLEKTRPSTGGRWYTGRSRDPAARSPENRGTAGTHDRKESHKLETTIQKTSNSQDIEQNIKRSTLVINEMESIVRNVMSSTTIGGEAMQPTAAIRQIRTVPPAVPEPVEAQAPAGLKIAEPGPWPASKKEDPVERPLISPHVPDMIEAARPALSLQKASGDAPENARSLSEALARSVGMRETPRISVTQDNAAEYKRPADSPASPLAYTTRAMSTIINTYATAGGATIAQSLAMAGATMGLSVSLSANPAMSGEPIAPLANAGAILSSGQPVAQPTNPVRGIMMGYEDIALNASRSIEALNGASPGAAIQSPIISLINNITAPVAVPSPAYAMAQAAAMPELANSLQISMPAGPGVIAQATQMRGPAVTLAASMAATHAAQKAGAAVIQEFVLASPAITGSVQLPAAVDRSVVNVSMPVKVEREQGGGVSRTSNYHNTFNINITMKGGGEDGDLKDLGKKIGRILSDEIKRYGGA